MSWEASVKIALVDSERYVGNLLKKLEGTPAAQVAIDAGIETLKGVVEAAIAPYVGPLDPEINAALDGFAKLLESKMAPMPAASPAATPVSST